MAFLKRAEQHAAGLSTAKAVALRDPSWPYPIWFQNLHEDGPGVNPRGVRVPVSWEGYFAILAVLGCYLGGAAMIISISSPLRFAGFGVAFLGVCIMLFAMALRTDYRSPSQRKKGI